jgi:hypothetical protein
MTDTTNINIVPLYRVMRAGKFRFRGTEYVVVEHMRSRTKIFRISDGREYVLSMDAKVEHVGEDREAFATALATRVEAGAVPTLAPGTTVRIVDNEFSRKRGLAGKEVVIVKRNSKTYSLANGWRVSPSMVEEV